MVMVTGPWCDWQRTLHASGWMSRGREVKPDQNKGITYPLTKGLKNC